MHQIILYNDNDKKWMRTERLGALLNIAKSVNGRMFTHGGSNARRGELFLEDVFVFLVLTAFGVLAVWAVWTSCKQKKKPDSHAARVDATKNCRSISELLDHLEQHFGIPLPEFRVQNFEYFFERLTYEAHDPGAVTSVTDQVLRHYRLDPSKVRIEADFLKQASEQGKEVRGQYQGAAQDYGKVRIILTPEDSEFDTVIAVIMHECAHYFSEIQQTKLEDREENERLTDVTAIWLGAGQRMERGCFPRANVRIGYLTQEECQYAIRETERRRQAAIFKSELFRQPFAKETAAQTAVIDRAEHVLNMEALCGEENQAILYALKEKCRCKKLQLTKIYTQMQHAMSKDAYCEMNQQLLRTALAARQEMGPALGAFDTFRPLTMEGLQMDQTAYTYYAAACEHARAGNVFSQFEMLRFYNTHPSEIALEEASCLLGKLEKADAADAYYLLGRCWNEGICVTADQNAAVRWWVQAAGRGSEQAERALRELYQSQPKP